MFRPFDQDEEEETARIEDLDRKEKEEEEEDKLEGELETTKVVAGKDPDQPSKKEFEDHQYTHLPFRNWCSRCVEMRKSAPAHWRIKDMGVEEETVK